MNHTHHQYFSSNLTERSLLSKLTDDDESTSHDGYFHRQMVFHFGYKEVILFDFWRTNTLFSEFFSF